MTASLVAVASAAMLAAGVVRQSFWLTFGGAFASLTWIGMAVAAICVWAVKRSERRLRHRVDQVELTVNETREKASRHEYHQKRALERIERTGHEVAVTTAGLAWMRPQVAPDTGPDLVPHVLFVTSNGGGMGHIARCAAVIRHAQGLLTGRILTLSTAAELVRGAGFDVDYFASQEHSERGSEWWRRQFTRRLMTEIAERRPSAIVFDGTWVYPSLTDVAEYADLPLVWLRRGLWREGTDLTQVECWRDHVTSVITPSDIAESREHAPEAFRDALWTDPVSLAPDTLPSREHALSVLGLDSSRRYALVQLSGGNANGAATAAAVEAVRAVSDIVPVVVKSPLLPDWVSHNAVTIDALFPLVDVATAWEYTVTGSGYNSVHENLHTRTPGIYLPSKSTVTDDQARRAWAVHEHGLGVSVACVEDLAAAARSLSAGGRSHEVLSALSENGIVNGATAVAHKLGTETVIDVRRNTGS